MSRATVWIVEKPNDTLAAFIKAAAGVPWTVAKRHVTTGKVFVDGAAITQVDFRVATGQKIELRMAAPKPRDPDREGVLVFDDAHVVVIDKPSGISSVPYDDQKTGTAMDLIRGAWRRMGRAATQTPLHVVHRIDRATSGLLCFAKTKRAELGLATQLREHTMERMYTCVAHGTMTTRRIESWLVADRGDGIRGSTTRHDQGKRAVTHVEAIRSLRAATLCNVRLETGKTHQIRIHFAEAGHPLVGEEVYVRDYTRDMINSPRMLLHAATLGFIHPVTNERVSLSAALPLDFTSVVERLA